MSFTQAHGSLVVAPRTAPATVRVVIMQSAAMHQTHRKNGGWPRPKPAAVGFGLGGVPLAWTIARSTDEDFAPCPRAYVTFVLLTSQRPGLL